MKDIREGYAKDYQEKMTRGFQEIDELKKDIASKQEIHDTKQVRELRREMKRLEDEILSQRTEKAGILSQNEKLRDIIKEKDTVIDKMLNGT